MGLRTELGADLEVLAELTDQESDDLLEFLRAARVSQRQALDAALDEALGHLPWPIRGSARKILFG